MSAKKMTERQLEELKEAKKLKLYTTLFVLALAVIVVIAVVASVSHLVNNSGMREKKTVALTVGDHSISNAELNYYFVDAVNNFYSQYSSYLALTGLDATTPLDKQYINEEAGITWADNFMETAKNSVQSVYALTDAAAAAGYTLPEAERSAVETQMTNMKAYCMLYGYSDFDTYLKAVYGKAASEETYTDYYMQNTLAQSYYSAYAEDLSFGADEIAAKDAENTLLYNHYSYNTYYMGASAFRQGGTTDEDGKTTYSDEEIAAGVVACEVAAKQLADSKEITNVDELNEAISALSINKDAETPVSSVAYTDYAYENINGVVRAWVTDPARKAGDLTYIANTSVNTDDDGNEVENVLGYYVVMFNEMNDNNFALANVRHILVKFPGGTVDSSTGATTYSEAEKAAAKETAEELMNTWKSGAATEESFSELATEKSDDAGSIGSGGLYEDVAPGVMVANFEAWCFDDRKPGDTGMVETEYGYHLMYYVGDSDTTYRDYLVSNVLRSEALDNWYTALTEAMPVVEKNVSYISTDLVLNRGN